MVPVSLSFPVPSSHSNIEISQKCPPALCITQIFAIFCLVLFMDWTIEAIASTLISHMGKARLSELNQGLRTGNMQNTFQFCCPAQWFLYPTLCLLFLYQGLAYKLKLPQNNKLSNELMSMRMLSYHQEVSGVKILLLSVCIKT